MKRIGHYVIERDGGRWLIFGRDGLVISSHGSNWDAIRAARDLNWSDVHEKKRPPVGGPEEPKSKWRRVI